MPGILTRIVSLKSFSSYEIFGFNIIYIGFIQYIIGLMFPHLSINDFGELSDALPNFLNLQIEEINYKTIL